MYIPSVGRKGILATSLRHMFTTGQVIWAPVSTDRGHLPALPEMLSRQVQSGSFQRGRGLPSNSLQRRESTDKPATPPRKGLSTVAMQLLQSSASLGGLTLPALSTISPNSGCILKNQVSEFEYQGFFFFFLKQPFLLHNYKIRS